MRQEELKICKVCNQAKEHSLFSPHARTPDGLHPRCKQCRSKQNSAGASKWNRENKERYQMNQRVWNDKQRAAKKKRAEKKSARQEAQSTQY